MKTKQRLVLAVSVICAAALGVVADLAGSSSSDGNGSGGESGSVRRYYLTKGRYTASQVLRACGRGYHLASEWEMIQPGVMAYNAERGYKNAPYQMGPPTSNWPETAGWLDDGRVPDGGENCQGWTTVDPPPGAYVGVTLSLGGAGSWDRRQTDCSESYRVWCISN